MTLEKYEEEVLLGLYDNGLIGNSYKSIQKVCSIIKWFKIAQKYKVKKSCKNLLRHLKSKGYVDFHGKAGNIASLTKLGVDYVIGKRKLRSKQP